MINGAWILLPLTPVIVLVFFRFLLFAYDLGDWIKECRGQERERR